MPANQTMQANLTKLTRVVIPIDITQLRDQIRSQHPLLAAISDKIQTMDAKDTLKYTIGVDIVTNMLKIKSIADRCLIGYNYAMTKSVLLVSAVY
jgi:hypothetical protein